MASEPNNKMDDALKAYAKKRREDAGAPVEMHPATRKLLQGEIARVYAKRGSGRQSGIVALLLNFWPRIAAASGVIALLAVAIFGVVPALREQKQMTQLTPEAASAPAAAAPESKERELLERKKAERPVRFSDELSLADKDGGSLEQDKLKRDAAAVNERAKDNVMLQSDDKRVNRLRVADASTASESIRAPVPTDQPAGAKAGVATPVPAQKPAENQLAKQVLEEQNVLAFAETNYKPVNGQVTNATLGRADVSKLGVNAPGAAGPVSDREAGLAQARNAWKMTESLQDTNGSGWYVQTGIGQAVGGALNDSFYSTTGPQPVLNSFHFEQTGTRVLIRDSDGSIYEGQVAPESERLSELRRESQKAQAGKELDGAQRGLQTVPARQVFFRARGTNQSLRKPVTIEATLSSDGVVAQTQAANAPAPAQPSPQLQPSSSSAVSGALPQVRLQTATQQNSGIASRQFGIQQQPLSLIQGRARIGTNQEIQIQAVPAQR